MSYYLILGNSKTIKIHWNISLALISKSGLTLSNNILKLSVRPRITKLLVAYSWYQNNIKKYARVGVYCCYIILKYMAALRNTKKCLYSYCYLYIFNIYTII